MTCARKDAIHHTLKHGEASPLLTEETKQAKNKFAHTRNLFSLQHLEQITREELFSRTLSLFFSDMEANEVEHKFARVCNSFLVHFFHFIMKFRIY